SPIFKLAIWVALALIAWATFGLFESKRKVDKSVNHFYSIRGEYTRVENFVQTNIAELNGAMTAAAETGDPARRSRFETLAQGWDRWLEQEGRYLNQGLPVSSDMYNSGVRKGLLPLLAAIALD